VELLARLASMDKAGRPAARVVQTLAAALPLAGRGRVAQPRTGVQASVQVAAVDWETVAGVMLGCQTPLAVSPMSRSVAVAACLVQAAKPASARMEARAPEAGQTLAARRTSAAR